MSRAFVSGSPMVIPDNSEMCANHDDPPKVGDVTNAETTSLPLSRMAASSSARRADVWALNSGRSNVTAPYDSMKNSRTSAPPRRDRSLSNEGLAASVMLPRSALTTDFA